MPWDAGVDSLLLWMLMFFIFGVLWSYLTPQLMSMQSSLLLSKVRKSVKELEEWAKETKRIALLSLQKHGRTKRDLEEELGNFLEFFAIEPVSEDPVGVIQRLDHILDVRKKRFEDAVARFAPKADPEEAATLEMVIEGAMATHYLYRIVRHFLLLAEKTRSYQLAMAIQMYMPIFKEYAKAYRDATKVFSEGKPIGDGVGALVAAKLFDGAKVKELVEDTVVGEVEFEGRKLLVVKAKGPGGRVGKPGELISKLVKKRKIARIIMVDAALKLEGEKSGEVIEGVGAAIGGPPTEKYKIEQVAVKHRIPLDAIVIKESFREAITQMNSRIAKAADETVERVKRAVRERTKPGDWVIVAGIGNTIGIGQGKDLPKDFPPPTKEEEIESNKLFIPV
ncbi:MAG: DUF1512 domain-containing protein [Candidatus Hadarchaeales archaeon]